MSDVTAEIEALLRQTEAIWDAGDYVRLKELWDTDDADPIYMPEELDHPLMGWPAVERYWDPVPGKKVIEAIRNRYSNVKAKLLAPGLAVAFYELRFDMKIVGDSKPRGGNDRVVAIFRKKPEWWRYVCYAEAPLCATAYVRKLCEDSVVPEFDDFHKKAVAQADPDTFITFAQAWSYAAIAKNDDNSGDSGID